MKTTIRVAVIAAVLTLGACGGSASEDEDKDKETVFDPMVDNIDKAREVEEQVMQQKQQLDAAIKAAEGDVDEDDGTR